jgi:urease beta subunit
VIGDRTIVIARHSDRIIQLGRHFYD